MTATHEPIPADFEVQPLGSGETAEDMATCGHCGLSWDDGRVTSCTPAPGGRCPFEAFHTYPDDEEADEPETVGDGCDWPPVETPELLARYDRVERSQAARVDGPGLYCRLYLSPHTAYPTPPEGYRLARVFLEFDPCGPTRGIHAGADHFDDAAEDLAAQIDCQLRMTAVAYPVPDDDRPSLKAKHHPDRPEQWGKWEEC